MNMATKSDVIEDGCSLKEFDLLKSSRDSHLGPLIWFEPGDFFFFKMDFASLGVVETVDAIQKNCFPSAIRTDNRKDFSFFNLKAYIHQSLDTSESHMEVVDFKLDLIGDRHQELLSQLHSDTPPLVGFPPGKGENPLIEAIHF
jgi:hypothetical protein